MMKNKAVSRAFPLDNCDNSPLLIGEINQN